MIDEKLYFRIYKRVENLMHTISNKIGGDSVLNSHEDSMQNLSLVILDAVNGYNKLYPDKELSDFIDDNTFHKYLKSCLWKYRGNVGAKITKKKNDVGISNFTDILSLVDSDKLQYSFVTKKVEEGLCKVDFNDISKILTGDEKRILKYLVNYPSCYTNNGNINLNSLSKKMRRSPYEVKKILKQLRIKYG